MRDDRPTIGYSETGDAPTLDTSALQTIKVPFSFFVGTNDILSTPEDTRKTRDLLGEDAMFYYEELAADHLSLICGKDMTYFKERVLPILQEHQHYP